MKMNEISTIGRPVDFAYPTNRTIAIITLVVIVTGTLFQKLTGVVWGESLSWGFRAGLTVFLAWALGRELDPDRAMTAFVGAALTLISIFFWGIPNLGSLFWILLALRVVNRTTGMSATLLDSLGFLGLGGWLTFQGNWGIGLLTALAFFLDGWMDEEDRRSWIFAALGVIVTVVALISGAAPWQGERFSWSAVGISLVGAALFVPVILRTQTVSSVCDRTDETVNPLRVQIGQALATLIGMEIALWNGLVGLGDSFPLWAVMLGVILYRLFSLFSGK